MVLLLVWGFGAQVTAQTGENRGSVKMDWMQPFEAVSVEGPVKVIFSRVAEGEQMRISYDTKANTDSRVKASVDKYGVLNIRERGLREGADSIEVYVHYKELKSLSINEASFVFKNTLEQAQMDLSFSGGATGELPLQSKDVVMTMTGKCRVVLKGQARYFDLKISTAKFNGSAFETMSARVNASHGAEVTVMATERLEASAQQAQVLYDGNPSIIRTTAGFSGRVEQVGKVTLVGDKK